MATNYVFNGKVVKLPGAYSTIKSITPSAIQSNSYGRVLIINTDPGLSFGGSINGELTKGLNALYRFRTLNEARSFLRSGYLWNLAEGLFKPSRSEGVFGCSDLYFINALTTKAPTISLTANTTEVLTIKVKDEGTTSNAVVELGRLISGYYLQISTGVKDPLKYTISVYRGSYKGESPDKYAWDGVSKSDTNEELIFQSPEITTTSEFVQWSSSNSNFSDGFEVTKHTETNISALKVTTPVLATGGTATYTAADLTTTLETLQDLDFNILFSLKKEGDQTADTINAKLQYFVQSATSSPKFLVIPGKSTGMSSDLTDNFNTAKSYNSQRVWLVHGIPQVKTSFTPNGYRTLDTLYMAALMVGRISGLQPQIPPTFKDLNIVGLQIPLTTYQREDCLDKGVLTAVYDNELESFVILRGVNTLQNNTSIQNQDGSSFSIQITRICSQINQDIILNAKKQIFGDQQGVNVSTVSEVSLADWVRIFLTSKVATSTQDNLILSFSDVNVERKGDSYWVSYKFRTNTEVAFIFFTGFAIN